MWLISLLLVACSAVGAWMSVKIKSGQISGLWVYLSAAATTTIWIRFAKADVRLSFAAVLFDVLSIGTYLAVMVMMGERLSLVQSAGLLLSVAGLLLISSGC